MTATLDLWPIGNCQVSALVDRAGRFSWACVPQAFFDQRIYRMAGKGYPRNQLAGMYRAARIGLVPPCAMA